MLNYECWPCCESEWFLVLLWFWKSLMAVTVGLWGTSILDTVLAICYFFDVWKQLMHGSTTRYGDCNSRKWRVKDSGYDYTSLRTSYSLPFLRNSLLTDKNTINICTIMLFCLSFILWLYSIYCHLIFFVQFSSCWTTRILHRAWNGGLQICTVIATRKIKRLLNWKISWRVSNLFILLICLFIFLWWLHLNITIYRCSKSTVLVQQLLVTNFQAVIGFSFNTLNNNNHLTAVCPGQPG